MLFRNDAEILGFTGGAKAFQTCASARVCGGGLQSTSYLGPQQGVGTGVNILPGFTQALFKAWYVCLSMEQTAPWHRLWFPLTEQMSAEGQTVLL